MPQIKEKILKAIIDPSIYNQVKSLYDQFNTNPHPYDFLVQTPEELQQDFREGYGAFAKRIADAMTMLKEKFPNNNQLLQDQHVVYDLSTFYLNWQAFLTTIQMLGTEEQVKYWTEQIFAYKVTGAYGQTEIGHGSNVQGLELQANYNSESDSFTLNSPSASAYKYWPGMLGIFATHTVAQAQTYINGKHIGLQTFVIPIRDPKTFESLQGVDVGDIGPKLGFLKADNGYLGFNNFQIPRENMLMRYTQINKQGEVSTLSKDAIKFGYGSMLNLRVQLVFTFSLAGLSINNLAFHQLRDELENKSLSFKLLRSYVMNYGLLISNLKLKSIFETYQQQLVNKDPATSSTLKLAHLYSSQMKSISAWEAIKTSREAIFIAPFGHLNGSGIPVNYADNTPFATYEGDNNVLLQQTAQALLKYFASNSKKGIAEYFNKLDDNEGMIQLNYLHDLSEMERILERLSFKFSKFVLSQFQGNLQDGVKKAWNELHQSDLIKMAEIFGYVNVFKFIVQVINQEMPNISKSSLTIFEKFSRMFGCFLILEYRTLIVAFKIANISQIQILNSIDAICGDRIDFLNKCFEGINMFRFRKFLSLDWNKFNIKANL